MQIVKSGNDVIIVYFWLSEFFLFRFFVYLVYFRPVSNWNSLENIHKVDYNWHLTSATSPNVSLQYKTFIWFEWAKIEVYCLTYWWSVFNHEFLAVLAFCTKIRKNTKKHWFWMRMRSLWGHYEVIMTSLWRHYDVIMTCILLKLGSDLSKPVARHFNLPGHSHEHMEICGIYLHLGNNETRKRKEQRVIFKLGTLAPNGINERFSFA